MNLNKLKHLNREVKQWIEEVERRASAQPDINPEDSASQLSAQSKSVASRQSKSSSTSSLTKKRLIEEAAERKALEARLELLQQRKELAEKRLQLEKNRDEEDLRLRQAEERLIVKAELAQCIAREQVFREAEAAERANSPSGSEVPLTKPEMGNAEVKSNVTKCSVPLACH